MDDTLAPAPKPRLGVLGFFDALFVALGYFCAFTNVLVGLLHLPLAAGATVSLLGALAVIPLASHGRGAVRVAREVFVLAVLMLWGVALNHLAIATCHTTSCALENNVLRPLAEPQVFGLFGLYALTVLAYAVSRSRPEAQRPRVEALIHAGLMVGAAILLLVSIQFASMLPTGLFLPMTFPVIAPTLALALFALELRRRLLRRGSEVTVAVPVGDTSAYRVGGEIVVPAPVGIHRPTLARALALTPAIVGLHAVIQAVWLHRPGAAIEVFTATCGHALSRIPAEVVSQDCHYLCTVAAQGHPWLVSPERLGRRGATVIVVNRQLAIANAFEDLLHERWPRFGAWARRVYDRLGLPVSRLIRWKLLADLVYLAMKPAEWCFFVALLLLDRRPPEARIARMYRA